MINDTELRVNFIEMNKLLYNIDVILGMDVISLFGGVTVNAEGVRFLGTQCAVVTPCLKQRHVINDEDFHAVFEHGRWTVNWCWKDSEPDMTDAVIGYPMNPEKNKKFETEVNQWI